MSFSVRSSQVDSGPGSGKLDYILEVQSIESSEDPPPEEWSSVELVTPYKNPKRAAHRDGLYDPGTGEICAEYIPMSDSFILRHQYYKYPSVKDPGIEKALLEPDDKVIYPDDGKERYLALCEEMNQCPVRLFYNNLKKDIVSLSHYCVNPVGVRAMAIALQFNKFVKVLELTDNFLNIDACFHLGRSLAMNVTLEELNLSGCRIGPEGLRVLLSGLVSNKALVTLNLNRNQLTDVGGEHVAAAFQNGLEIRKLYLSYNMLGPKTMTAFSHTFEFRCRLIDIDLSWNNFYSPVGISTFLEHLKENRSEVEVLNLSWCSLYGPRIGTALGNVLRAANIQNVDLRNNRLKDEAITSIIEALPKAKKLVSLNLSSNPISPEEALNIVTKMRLVSVKLQNLHLDNVMVDPNFLEVVERMKKLKSKKNVVVTHGDVAVKPEFTGPDMRDLVLNRAEFLCKKPKKRPIDFALVILQLMKENVFIMDAKEFSQALNKNGALLDADLIEAMVSVFPGPRRKKIKTINLQLLQDFIKRKWPDRKLPLSPKPKEVTTAEDAPSAVIATEPTAVAVSAPAVVTAPGNTTSSTKQKNKK